LQGTRKTATFETLKPQDLRHFGDRWGTIVRTIDFSSASALDAGETEDEYFRLKSLANAGFAKEALRKVTDVILPLNDSGTGPAFYCVHDITGIATGFRFIAEMLGPRQRFYGIQAPTKKRNAEFASSIESISQYYVDDLIKFQPEGNFCWVVIQRERLLHFKWRNNCVSEAAKSAFLSCSTEISLTLAPRSSLVIRSIGSS
jgi:hypothetical protein